MGARIRKYGLNKEREELTHPRLNVQASPEWFGAGNARTAAANAQGWNVVANGVGRLGNVMTGIAINERQNEAIEQKKLLAEQERMQREAEAIQKRARGLELDKLTIDMTERLNAGLDQLGFGSGASGGGGSTGGGGGRQQSGQVSIGDIIDSGNKGKLLSLEGYEKNLADERSRIAENTNLSQEEKDYYYKRLNGFDIKTRPQVMDQIKRNQVQQQKLQTEAKFQNEWNETLRFIDDPEVFSRKSKDYDNNLSNFILQHHSDPDTGRMIFRSYLWPKYKSAADMMADAGRYQDAIDLIDSKSLLLPPGKAKEYKKELSDKQLIAGAPILAKEIIKRNPDNPAAQIAAADGINDGKQRELVRSEIKVQNSILQVQKQQQQQEVFRNVLAVSLRMEDGSVPTTYNHQTVPLDIIDKVRETRDRIIGNLTGNINYYYDVKEQIETGRIKDIGFDTVDLGQLTTEQVQNLYKAKDERNKNPGKSESAKYVATFNEQCKTEISAAGFDGDSKQESRILSQARSRFEHEKLVKKRDLNWDERQKIINDCIGDLTPGEEKQGFFNDNMTLGEAKKQGYEKVFEPDTPENLASGAQWLNDVGAFVRPDNSEYGVTLQDGSGRDVTPLNLETGTKWNNRINRFINTTDKSRKIFDTSGKLIFEMPKAAQYNAQINAFTYADNVSIDGVMKPCVRIYDLNDGRVSLQFRK